MRKIKINTIKINDWGLIRLKDKGDRRWAITFYKKKGITYYSNQKGKFIGHFTHKTLTEIKDIIFDFYGLLDKNSDFEVFKMNKREIKIFSRKIILYNLEDGRD